MYQWEGNSEVGSGRMEITDTSAPSKVVIKLDFIKPFEGHNVAEFALVPQGGTTPASPISRPLRKNRVIYPSPKFDQSIPGGGGWFSDF